MNGNRPRLIHPSSNRNAAFSWLGARGPPSLDQGTSLCTLIAPRRHIVPCVRSRGCAAKGRSTSALLVERKSRGYVIPLWVYQTSVVTNGVCPLRKTPEKPRYIDVYDVFISSRKCIEDISRESDRTCTFQP